MPALCALYVPFVVSLNKFMLIYSVAFTTLLVLVNYIHAAVISCEVKDIFQIFYVVVDFFFFYFMNNQGLVNYFDGVSFTCGFYGYFKIFAVNCKKDVIFFHLGRIFHCVFRPFRLRVLQFL